MKIFWPHRSNPKGFLIENLALKYRDKISSISSKEISNQSLNNRDLKSSDENSNLLDLSDKYVKREHWANRDFSEYLDVA